ncbi:MAG: hypothetical protein WCG67_06800, partial [Ferruginibacter sp.]
VFPIKYDVKKSADYLSQTLQTKPTLIDFAARLKEAFSYFEDKKQLPIIVINKKGEYIIN